MSCVERSATRKLKNAYSKHWTPVAVIQSFWIFAQVFLHKNGSDVSYFCDRKATSFFQINQSFISLRLKNILNRSSMDSRIDGLKRTLQIGESDESEPVSINSNRPKSTLIQPWKKVKSHAEQALARYVLNDQFFGHQQQTGSSGQIWDSKDSSLDSVASLSQNQLSSTSEPKRLISNYHSTWVPSIISYDAS